MQKFLIPILIILILVAGGGGYYLGLQQGTSQGVNQGRTALQKELQDKEEAYKKSKDAVKDVATKYFGAYKFKDFKEIYNLVCSDAIYKSDEAKLLKIFESNMKDINDAGVNIQEMKIDDIILNADTAKVRFTEVRWNLLLSKEYRLPEQVQFKFMNGEWCLKEFQ